MSGRDLAIENKLLAKKEFLQLGEKLNRFNVFEATDMGRREIKHTKFLSYLLDPNESHGIGEFFIKNFVTRVSNIGTHESLQKFPGILDLDFSFAEIKAESKLKNGSLDIFIKIPSRRGGDGYELIIAVENKLEATQNTDQLEKYSEGLTKVFGDIDPKNIKLLKIFLTLYEEKPDDDSWIAITYRDTILPAVSSTIEFLEETGSDHLKAILNDYHELLVDDEDGEKVEDGWAAVLIQDTDIKQYVETRGAKGKDKRKESFGPVYVKHKKVIDYLCEFDGDNRTPILNLWKKLKSNVSVSDDLDLILKFEKSERAYLRFNVLSESNRRELSSLSDQSRKWLDGLCPIAFELIIKPSNDNKFRCCATLVLGPIVSDEERIKLIQAIYPALQLGDVPRDIGDERCKGIFTRLISTSKGQWVKGKTTDEENPLRWINSEILEIKDDAVILKDWIKELAVKLNKSLDEYF